MARVFDGSTSNYFSATGLKYDIPANFSVVWRAKTSSDTDQAVMGRRDSSGAGGFVVKRDSAFNSVLVSLFGVADIFQATGTNPWPSDGAYHSFIVTKSGTTWTLYVDSTTALGTATSSYTTTTGPDLYVGAWNNAAGAGVTDPFNGSLYDVALFPSVLGSTDRTNFLAGTAPSGLTAAGTDHYWPMDNAAAGNESDSFGSATLTEVGTVTYESTVVAPVITGPSGAAGAGSSTANLAELATTGPTFSTDIALGVGYPTLTGADAASFTLTSLSSTSWRVDPVTPFNFESLPHSNPFNVTFNATASVSQTCAITVTNVNEAPTFSGTISVPGLTEGVAMSAINAALLFSDPDSGDTGTYAAVGTWPTGVTVSSGGLISGTPAAATAATYNSLRVRRTDGGGLTADTNSFTITVSATGTAPTVSSHPSDTTVTAGATASFTAAASGSPTPTVQWQENTGAWTNISGQTSTTLSLGVVGTGDNGRVFRAVFTNTSGSATTNSATLTVNAASGDGTITSEPLKRNNGQLLGANTLSWLGVRNSTTGAHVLLLTGVAVNSSSVFTVTNAAMSIGQPYTLTWKTATGEYGCGWTNAV